MYSMKNGFADRKSEGSMIFRSAKSFDWRRRNSRRFTHPVDLLFDGYRGLGEDLFARLARLRGRDDVLQGGIDQEEETDEQQERLKKTKPGPFRRFALSSAQCSPSGKSGLELWRGPIPETGRGVSCSDNSTGAIRFPVPVIRSIGTPSAMMAKGRSRCPLAPESRSPDPGAG